MKKTIIFALTLGLACTSCVDLDLNPLSQGISNNWNNTPEKIRMSANALFNAGLWVTVNDFWTDDELNRNYRNDFVDGTLTGENSDVKKMWQECYRAIGRDHALMKDLLEMGNPGILPQTEYNQYLGECYFVRACMYSRLVFHYGDVPYCDHEIDIDTAFKMGRTPKEEILKHIYKDFEDAVKLLPEKSPAEQRVTRGAALGMWARTALWFSDWDTVIKCTQAIMDLEIYELHPDFGELFLSTTHNTKESLFSLARSVDYQITWDGWRDRVPRNNGGYATYSPSWELLAGFLCKDGLPIDESPLFDRRDPTKNRDPRCSATIVEFGSEILGYEYDPNVVTGVKVMNYNTGAEVTNKDNKKSSDVAAYNGLVWRKYMDESCYQNSWKTGHDLIVLRYADVLLMYAEAKIEKGEIDQSVLDAMNEVRARAYEAKLGETDKYPEITTMDQNELRTLIRYERRMELAKENNRYYDLARWRLFGEAFKDKAYGIFQNSSIVQKNMNDTDMWLWGFVPPMDENGLSDFSRYEEIKGQAPDAYNGFAYVLQTRNFQDKLYLWPIPANDVLINDNIDQNPGY